jgi:multidrug efflux pump subunit AcrA (membrane-fusion protein)
MKKRNILKIIIIAAVVLVVLRVGPALIGGGGSSTQAGAGQPAAPEVPVFAVNTTTAVTGHIGDYLSLSGDLIAASVVEVYSDIAGLITRVNITAGAQVRRDDPLFLVDPSRPGMAFLPGVVRAPIAGTIVSLTGRQGLTVNQAVPLARISARNALEIQLYAPEKFISRMSPGLSCEISFDAFPGMEFQGRVSSVSPTVDPVSRTMELRAVVDNSGSQLKPGMFAQVKIITKEKDNIVKVPSAAMVQRFGENLVFVVQDDPASPTGKTVKRKAVKAGILIDNVLEIEEGLTAGDEVVIRGQSLLEDGSCVNVVEKTAALSAN